MRFTPGTTARILTAAILAVAAMPGCRLGGPTYDDGGPDEVYIGGQWVRRDHGHDDHGDQNWHDNNAHAGPNHAALGDHGNAHSEGGSHTAAPAAGAEHGGGGGGGGEHGGGGGSGGGGGGGDAGGHGK